MSTEVVSATVLVTPLRTYGFEQWRAQVVTATGRVLFESTRWSEAQCRADAARWIARNQYESLHPQT
jgi:hypothetical protein